ncbi:hypothetical protein B9Z19DRAFT_1129482 [Tuber borchii]|uniref:Uncharacterized protein n=1 Tax=Tuber borchii TaxID=42251 RepID=A0A2T6ZMD0_TUBBO|nr:hypothetical protein B9Z19DRAFT_1129482 [Tuber borchii]
MGDPPVAPLRSIRFASDARQTPDRLPPSVIRAVLVLYCRVPSEDCKPQLIRLKPELGHFTEVVVEWREGRRGTQTKLKPKSQNGTTRPLSSALELLAKEVGPGLIFNTFISTGSTFWLLVPGLYQQEEKDNCFAVDAKCKGDDGILKFSERIFLMPGSAIQVSAIRVFDRRSNASFIRA